MSSSLDLTRDWLRNVLKPYPARDRVLPEVMEILTNRRTLSVKTDAFTFDNGQTALLVLLHGTLPINFRGATYHIPVHIWVPHDYPRMPPLAFVVPTKEMGVRKGREVEPGGRVTESVVQFWWDGWQDKSIEKLLGQLTSIFSATPPVYAKPAGPVRAPVLAPVPAAPAPISPAPASSSRQAPQPNDDGFSVWRPSMIVHRQQPPAPARPSPGPPPIATESLPRYQSEQTPPPHPFPHQRVMQPEGPLRQMSSPPVPNRPNPLPPRAGSQGPISPGGPVLPPRPYIPHAQGGQPPTSPTAGPSYTGPRYSQSPPPQQGWQPGPGPVQAMSGNNQPPAPGPPGQLFGPVNGQYQQQFPHQRQPSGRYHPQAPAPSQSPHPAQYAPPPPQTQPPVPAAAPVQAQQQPPTRRPMQDLLSSPEDPISDLPSSSQLRSPGAPPPVPPSKPPPPSLLHLHSILLPHLQASLPPLIHSLEANRQQLSERHEDLVSGEPAIKDEMARLEAVKKVCDSVGKKLGDAVAQGQERVAELEARGEVSVDEVVCGISIVHNQLIDLVAEDNAIEDTIYHMTRALDNERIDLDRYMKAIRQLAREQYMKRALIERILQGMGQTQGW